MKNVTLLGSMMVALMCGASVFAAKVERMMLPERLSRGNTAIAPQSPIDNAAWISPRDSDVPNGGLFLRFRKDFQADGKSELKFHVSADERFILLLDGEVVARGPDRGEPNMWFFQSYVTMPSEGRHVFDAIVWKMRPEHSTNAQLTHRLGFTFAAEDVYDKALTTGKSAWKVAVLKGTVMTKGKYPMSACGAQCIVNGTDILSEEPPAGSWTNPIVVRGPIVANPSFSHRYPGWIMYPSQLPAQLSREVHPGTCVAVDNQAFVTNGIHFKSGPYDEWGSNAVFCAESATDSRREDFDRLLKDGASLTIPARTSVRYLWNMGEYYCAYPQLKVSGGKGSVVSWGWAEALYVGDCFDWHTVVVDKVRKGMGNRNEFIGKYFYGPQDVFAVDGRKEASFTIPWWRCGLYCLIEIRTGDEPLTINKLSLMETRYPIDPEAYFHCDDETLDSVQAVCLRGLQMCMHEMHFDCPFYEQQMYGGDTRLQMKICQALSPDDSLNRQAFRLFEISQRDNGMISMNYPTKWLQESTSFSQYWAMMLGDYAMWRDNPAWVRSRMPAVRRLLFGLEELVNADGLQENAPGWYFIDWVPDWPSGTAPDGKVGQGVSAINNLLYLLTLQQAEKVERCLGETELAARWSRRSKALAKKIVEKFWSEDRGMIADTVRKDSYSEHAQALAIITEVLSEKMQARVIDALASEPDLACCTASFASYLFEAYFKCGRTDLFLKKLDVWREYVRMGLRTPLEGPGDARSDCHAWSSNPLYHLHTGIAGVNPAEPGYKSVIVRPQPGLLKWIKAKSSTAKGYVLSDLSFANGNAKGVVTLPDGLHGNFVWRGKTIPLAPGKNSINL